MRRVGFLEYRGYLVLGRLIQVLRVGLVRKGILVFSFSAFCAWVKQHRLSPSPLSWSVFPILDAAWDLRALF